MYRQLVIAAATLSTALLPLSGLAQGPAQDYAKVVSVTPEYDRVAVPRQECRDEVVQTSRPSDDRSNSGAVIGGIAGAIIGSQVGKGNGNKAAIAAGAVTGAIAGDRIDNRSSNSQGSTQTVRRCYTVEHWDNRRTGYRVTYVYGGKSYATVMSYDPGPEIRVRVSVEPY